MSDIRKQMMTIEDLAHYLNISPETIRSSCSKKPNTLPRFLKTGSSANSQIRFRHEDVETWIEDKLRLQDEASRSATSDNAIDWGI